MGSTKLKTENLEEKKARLRAERLGLAVATPPKGKPGRKASALRGLPPEAARRAISAASVKAVRAAVQLQASIAKANPFGNAPTLERLLLADVELVSIQVAHEGEVSFRPAISAKSLEQRLVDAGLEKRLAWVADRFVDDVEGATIGKLTASYGEGRGGGTAGEPERVFAAMQRLTRAQESLTPKERTAVWGALVFGLSMTDLGWALAGNRFGERREPLINAAEIFLEGALERMAPWYEARG